MLRRNGMPNCSASKPGSSKPGAFYCKHGPPAFSSATAKDEKTSTYFRIERLMVGVFPANPIFPESITIV